MSGTLEAELEQLAGEVTCLRCHHGYTSHQDGGGHCRGVVSNGPMYRLPCMCPGMRWVDPAGPPVSYDSRPSA